MQCFEAFRQRHVGLEESIIDEQFAAVCSFLKSWDPASVPKEKLDEIGPGFGVFRIQGEDQYVHERPAVRRWWCGHLTDAATTSGDSAQCLVTGRTSRIARLHEPKIKGVIDKQPPPAAPPLSRSTSMRRSRTDTDRATMRRLRIKWHLPIARP